MRSVESEGATIDLAISAALGALGAERDQVEVEILESGRPGLLGIGRKPARVRATMRAAVGSWLGVEAAEKQAVPRETMPETAAPHQQEESDAGERDLLVQLLRLMGFGGTQVRRITSEGGERHLEITGPESEEIVGRHGEVLEALEYVLNRMLERRGGVHQARIVLDAVGHLAKRQSALEDSARKLAERVRQRGKAATMRSPLNPGDRHVVEIALQSEKGVAARTIGRGFYRRLVIVPRGARGGGGDTRE